jgi:multidrug efflux pump subunit AcrB
VVASGGQIAASGLAMTVTTSGEIRTLDELRNTLISVPGAAGARQIPLSQLARIELMPADPPDTAAIYQGQPAVVVAVSMAPGYNIAQVGQALRQKLGETARMLPVGFSQHVVTFQADVVEREMGKMHHVMGETVLIVMAVVMLFLGWRTGLIVGAIVPLTILGTLIAMRALSVELQTVSIAAIILALGLLVDNGIVIAEDIERRLAAGEDRRQACEAAGRTLALPLLTSSLVIVLAFSPFFFGQTSTNEYMRSLAIVLAVTLLGSWLLSVTVTPLLCMYFARAHRSAHADGADHYDSRLYRGYRRIIETLLGHKALFLGSMLLLLAGAATVLGSIPYSFLPKSDRLQFQIPLTLQPGSDARQTLRTVQSISRWLADRKRNPEIIDSIGYVADGGPRIVLGLNPPQAAANIAYFTVSVGPGTDLDAVIARVVGDRRDRAVLRTVGDPAPQPEPRHHRHRTQSADDHRPGRRRPDRQGRRAAPAAGLPHRDGRRTGGFGRGQPGLAAVHAACAGRDPVAVHLAIQFVPQAVHRRRQHSVRADRPGPGAARQRLPVRLHGHLRPARAGRHHLQQRGAAAGAHRCRTGRWPWPA